mgnify:CR=1 FL=1
MGATHFYGDFEDPIIGIKPVASDKPIAKPTPAIAAAPDQSPKK